MKTTKLKRTFKFSALRKGKAWLWSEALPAYQEKDYWGPDGRPRPLSFAHLLKVKVNEADQKLTISIKIYDADAILDARDEYEDEHDGDDADFEWGWAIRDFGATAYLYKDVSELDDNEEYQNTKDWAEHDTAVPVEIGGESWTLHIIATED